MVSRDTFGWGMAVVTTAITPSVLVLVNRRHSIKLLKQVGDDFKPEHFDAFIEQVRLTQKCAHTSADTT